MSKEEDILRKAEEVFNTQNANNKIVNEDSERLTRRERRELEEESKKSHRREKKEKRDKPKSKFKKFLKIYVLILVILMIAALVYVFDSLKKYENNQIDNYMTNTISVLTKSAEKGKIEEYIDKNEFTLSKFEKDGTTINDGIAQILKDKNITYKRTDKNLNDEKQVYTLYADEKPILDVHLDGTSKETRLSILTFSKWKIEKVTKNSENGFYSCLVSAPSNCKVYVNGKELGKDNILAEDKEDALEEVAKYANVAHLVKYQVNDLIVKPEVKILNSKNEEQEYKIDEKTGEYIKNLEYTKIKTKAEAMKKIKGTVNIEKIAENWSLFLTDDLPRKITWILHNKHLCYKKFINV